MSRTVSVSALVLAAGVFAAPAQAVPGWNSQTSRRVPFNTISNLAEADAAIAAGPIAGGTGLAAAVNYFNPGGGGGVGNFGGDINPFGLGGGDENDFAVLSTGFLKISQAGTYQFVNNTDDGSRLRLDLNQDGVFGGGEDIIIDNVLSGPHNAFSAILLLTPGAYRIEHTWFERGGGAEGDLGVQFNNTGGFHLVGNLSQTAFTNFGAFVDTTGVPEPATAMLGVLALGATGLRRRRRA